MSMAFILITQKKVKQDINKDEDLRDDEESYLDMALLEAVGNSIRVDEAGDGVDEDQKNVP